MSRAYKCDRCGKLFEIDYVTHENEQQYDIGYKCNGERRFTWDFCSQCQKAFSDFLCGKTYTPEDVLNTIVVHGQNDTQRFKIGETIKYTPTEIYNILNRGETDADSCNPHQP